jgi:hypothetical protein
MWDGDDPATPGEDTGDNGLSLGYAGIALLDAPMPLCSFQWWNWNEDPGNDNEMFQFMAGIHPASQGHPFRLDPDSVFDYRVLIATGPYTLNPGDSIYTAMTFAVGDSMDGLEQAVDEMASWYEQNILAVISPGLVTPAQYSLGQPRPNPFNSSTILTYELRAASMVTLAVWDTQGRLVETLVDGWKSAGSHSATFDGSGLTSGVYLYRLAAGSYKATGKMVLMK